MSLFGGDTAPSPSSEVPGPSSPGFPSEASDFSIEEVNPIYDNASQRAVSTDLEGSEAGVQTRESSQNIDRDDQHVEPETETDGEGDVNGLSRKWARAWRHYTNQERTLAVSLDQLRANDLAAHLYNAHAAKVHVRDDPSVIRRSGQAKRRKTTWIPKDKITGERPWCPDVEWTAWPLEPHQVPPPDQTFFSNSRLREGLPNSRLREELSAVFLRQAKVTWDRRQPVEQSKPTKQSDHSSGPTSESRPRTRSRSRSMSVAPSMSGRASASPPLGQSSPSSQFPSSPPTLPGLSPLPTTEVKDEELHAKPDVDVHAATILPVFSADDDRSDQLVAPTVSHIMANLDNLLMALHHQREGQFLRSRDAGDTSDSSTQSRESTSRSRSKSGIPTSKSNKQRAPTPAPERAPSPENNSDASGASTKSSASHNKHYRAGTHRSGLRDWSEILGIAALTGWDPAVVHRAANRCAALFSESMTFRTLPSNGPILDTDSPHHLSDLPDSGNKGPSSGYFCPFPLCVHHLRPYPRAWRWREHLKKKHGQSTAQIQRLEQDVQIRIAESGPAIMAHPRRHKILDFNPRGWTPSSPLRCQHCTDSPVYPALKRLLDHMKRTHKYDPRVEEEPVAEDPDASETADTDDEDDGSEEGSSEEEMVGGVRVDGFLRPCVRRAGRGRDGDARVGREARGDKGWSEGAKGVKRKRGH